MNPVTNRRVCIWDPDDCNCIRRIIMWIKAINYNHGSTTDVHQAPRKF